MTLSVPERAAVIVKDLIDIGALHHDHNSQAEALVIIQRNLFDDRITEVRVNGSSIVNAIAKGQCQINMEEIRR